MLTFLAISDYPFYFVDINIHKKFKQIISKRKTFYLFELCVCAHVNGHYIAVIPISITISMTFFSKIRKANAEKKRVNTLRHSFTHSRTRTRNEITREMAKHNVIHNPIQNRYRKKQQTVDTAIQTS